MNFDLTDEQLALEKTVDRYLDTEFPATRVREIFDGDVGLDEKLWLGLGEMGVLGLHLPEAVGGSGAEILDVAVVAEVLGRHAAPGPFSEHVLASLAIDLGGSEEQRERWLPKLASGEARATIALSETSTGDGRWLPEAWRIVATSSLDGCKYSVPYASGADVIVVGVAGGGLVLVTPGASVEIQRLEALDRTRRLDRVHFDATPFDPLPNGAEVTARVVDAGLVLLAADAYGGAVACLEAAVDYAKMREQFGALIGSFQALQHQLADMALEIYPCRGLVWFAAFAWDHLPKEASVAASNAKAHLTDRYLDVARKTVEAHGGVGYTWECFVQVWLKRAYLDWVLLGDPGQHRRRTAALLNW